MRWVDSATSDRMRVPERNFCISCYTWTQSCRVHNKDWKMVIHSLIIRVTLASPLEMNCIMKYLKKLVQPYFKKYIFKTQQPQNINLYYVQNTWQFSKFYYSPILRCVLPCLVTYTQDHCELCSCALYKCCYITSYSYIEVLSKHKPKLLWDEEAMEHKVEYRYGIRLSVTVYSGTSLKGPP